MHQVGIGSYFLLLFVTSAEKDESLQLQRRLDSNVPGLSLRNMMLRSATSVDRKLR